MKTIVAPQELIEDIREYSVTKIDKPILIWFGREKYSNLVLDSFKKLFMEQFRGIQYEQIGGVISTSSSSIILYHRYVAQMEESFLVDAIKTQKMTNKLVIVFANYYEMPNRPDWISNSFEELRYNPPLKISLVTCSSKKRTDGGKHRAEDLYVGPLFKKAWAYADRIGVDIKLILSDKYEVLSGDDLIYSYNNSIRSQNHIARKKWALRVLNNLKNRGLDLEKDEFVILAGYSYYEYLLGRNGIVNANVVFRDNQLHGIGQILHFLSQ